jgi:hypothetical protein
LRPEEYLYRPAEDDDFEEDRFEDDGGALKGNSLGNG